MSLKKQLGERIKELRQKNCLKQSELAEKVNIATKHQSCIETGKNYPSADLIESYAKVFQVDVAEILTIKHIKPRSELLSEINILLSKAKDDEVKIIHKIINDVVN